MAYASPSLARRSRRRRRLVIGVVLAVVLAVFALAIRYRTDRRQAVEYLAVAKEVAVAEERIGASLFGALESIGTTERQDLFDRLAGLMQDSADQRRRLTELEVPGLVAVPHAFLLVAVESWDDGIVQLDGAIRTILDSPEDPVGDASLREAFDLLRIGDRAYARFVAATGDLADEIEVEAFPEVAFTRQESLVFDETFLADRLRLLRALAERHDIAVAVTLDPTPVGQQNDLPVVPFSEEFTVQVVVSNAGNAVETDIPVTVELRLRDANEDPQSRDAVVSELRPGEATTLTFDDFTLTGGSIYELVVTADVPGDRDPTNSLFRLVFFRNDPE